MPVHRWIELVDPVVGVAVASVILGAALFYFLGRWRGRRLAKNERRASSDVEQSRSAHERAVERDPPVSIGDSVTLGIKEFQSHHTGKRSAVGKKEGFVIFVEDCPDGVSVGDRITATITSFGANRTSAEAVFDGTA